MVVFALLRHHFQLPTPISSLTSFGKGSAALYNCGVRVNELCEEVFGKRPEILRDPHARERLVDVCLVPQGMFLLHHPCKLTEYQRKRSFRSRFGSNL